MGARGPLPKDGLKLGPGEGANTGQSSQGSGEDLPEVAPPVKPEDLPDDVSGLWDEIVAAMVEQRRISTLDGPALELALRHLAVARKASEDLLDQEVVLQDEKNQRPMKNPASQVFRDHSTAFLAFAKELGLTFVSRVRQPLPEVGTGDSGNPFS